MVFLGGVNLTLSLLNSSDTITIPEPYFEVLSVLLTVIPVFWSSVLDSCKEYIDALTPLTPSSQTDTVIDSTLSTEEA